MTRYVGATEFVDNYSYFNYVHLMSKIDAEAAFEYNMLFERICDSYGVRVLHYHPYTGIFDTNKFK